jgi:hypothetical protein
MGRFATLIAIVLLAGCSTRQVDADRCNLTVIIDPAFAASTGAYAWMPGPGDSIWDGRGFSGGGSINFGGDGKGALAALAVVIAAAVVMVSVDIAAHNLDGADLELAVAGPGGSQVCRLEQGENRFALGDALMEDLRAGRATLTVRCTGTRRFSFALPEGLPPFDRDVNYIELTASGRLIVNGTRVERPEAVTKDPVRK